MLLVSGSPTPEDLDLQVPMRESPDSVHPLMIAERG